MSTPTELASQSFVNKVLGPVIAGWTAQLMFFGFAVHQYVAYRQSPLHAKDSLKTKTLLSIVMLFLCLQSAISFYSIYHYSTWQLRDEDTLYSQTLWDCFATGPVAVVGALVQSFLIVRASALFKTRVYRYIYLGFMHLCILASICGAVLYIAVSILYRQGRSLPPGLDFGVAVGIWLRTNAAIDIGVTTSLTLLLRSRIRSWNVVTDNLIRRIIRMAIYSASYTAVAALIGATLAFSFNVESEDSVYTNTAGAFYQPLSSFYTIALLTTLSSRATLSNENASGGSQPPSSGYQPHHPEPLPQKQKRKHQQPRLSRSRDHELELDSASSLDPYGCLPTPTPITLADVSTPSRHPPEGQPVQDDCHQLQFSPGTARDLDIEKGLTLSSSREDDSTEYQDEGEDEGEGVDVDDVGLDVTSRRRTSSSEEKKL